MVGENRKGTGERGDILTDRESTQRQDLRKGTKKGVTEWWFEQVWVLNLTVTHVGLDYGDGDRHGKEYSRSWYMR